MTSMSTREAAQVLGVTQRRVVELIHSGLLVAQRKGKTWAVSAESVAARAGSELSKGRPKGGEPRRHLVHDYTLMCKDAEVVDLSFATNRREVVSVGTPTNPELLPVGACSAPGKASVRSVEAWVSERYIPTNRIGLSRLLTEAGVDDPALLMFESLGLNLTDQYWFKPAGVKLAWADVNYFDNPIPSLSQRHGRGPDSGTPGMLGKWWEQRGEERFLIKESSNGGREPYAELCATSLYARLLDHDDYVPYSVEETEDGPHSVCPLFINRNTQLVTMRDLARCYKGKTSGFSSAGDYVTLLEQLGIADAAKQVSKMIVCDYLDANDDRHDRNLGVIRCTSTGEYLRVAPMFDNGRAFFTSAVRRSQLEDGLYLYDSNPFSSYPSVQLAQVADLSWFDVAHLNGFPDEAAEILQSNEQAPAWFGEAASSQLKRRIERVAEAYEERA